MFAKKTREDLELQKAIDRVFAEMSNADVDSPEYSAMSDQLTKLYQLKEDPQRVTPDTLALIAGNIAGIVLIVGHERAHIITSKALSFVMKMR